MPTAEANDLYEEYAALAKRDMTDAGVRVYFGGRLGEYKYINMDQAVERALKLVNQIYYSEI
jgi:UDP-galactopyranose mutase